jgi:Holliday junction resolvase RusA-like endonuclease
MIEIKIKPLSINEAYRGYRRRTDKYNSYINHVLLMLPNGFIMPKTEIKIRLEFGFSSNASDIDNCCKPFIDCLVKKYGVDDRNIIELTVIKKIVKKSNEYIKFEIL